jgi:AcrR family transcriptional regulator
MDLDPLARRPMTRRALAKQQTRRRLIAAAKALAGERGYEDATLRDIAARADLSTGAVFANFEDKADLFNAAIADDDEVLLATIQRAAQDAGSACQTLVEMLVAAQALQYDQLSWLRVKMGLSWSCGRRVGPRRIENALAAVVRNAVGCGALSQNADPDLIAEMAWNAYLGGCDRAIFDGWARERLNQRLAACVDALLGGFELRLASALEPNWPSSGPSAIAPRPRALRG